MGRPERWTAQADDLELPLKILGDRSLLFKHFTQLVRHRERAPLPILRFSRIEPDFPGAEIDLSPLERQNLAVDPPAGDVREDCSRSNGLRKMRQHREELIALEEPNPYVVFLQKRGEPPVATDFCSLELAGWRVLVMGATAPRPDSNSKNL
jgi:hypothetical protein